MRLLGLFALFTVLSFSSAQDPAPLSIAFVSSSQVLAAHPAGQAAETLTQQARTELEGIAVTLQPLQARAASGAQLTAEEQNQLELTQRTLQETQERFRQDIDDAAQPAEREIDGIIRQIAAENGYTLVLNFDVARTSGLILYADEGSVPNITEQVIAGIAGTEGGN